MDIILKIIILGPIITVMLIAANRFLEGLFKLLVGKDYKDFMKSIRRNK